MNQSLTPRSCFQSVKFTVPLRLMVAREHMLDGTIELDHFYLGGTPERQPDAPSPGRGRKGQAKTQKTPVMAIVSVRRKSLPALPRAMPVPPSSATSP
jgi:ISXO2-like transposase domain